MSIVIGIDPGFSGGIATIYTNSDRQPSVWPMPTLPGSKGKTELNHHDILCALDFGGHRGVVWLEKVGARPGQGVSSMFRFGQQLGALEMAVIAKGHELRYVTPAVWKNYFGLSADKGVARGYAMKRFPDVAHMFSRAKDDGLAEAALIALYGAEHGK